MSKDEILKLANEALNSYPPNINQLLVALQYCIEVMEKNDE